MTAESGMAGVMTAGGNGTGQTTVSSLLSTSVHNASFFKDCIPLVFSQLEFLPWDNPDNIVSAQAEMVASRLKNNVLVFFFLIGGPANVLNMAVFYKHGLQDRVNLCLFALSLADELHLLNALIHHGEQLVLQFTTMERTGPVATFLSNTNLGFLLGFHFVSYVLSAIIATERCLCIFNPLKFQRLLSTKTMAVIIIATYVLVMGMFFMVAFRYRVGCIYDPVADVTVITAVEGEFYSAHRVFIDQLESFLFGVGLPGVVMIAVIVTTAMTILKLRQVQKWRSQTSSSSTSTQELAVTKMLVANSIFFLVCLFPVAVNRFCWLFFPEVNPGRRHHNLFLMSLWIDEIITHINSTFNFLVYYISGSRFRETFRALLGRKSQVDKKRIATTKP